MDFTFSHSKDMFFNGHRQLIVAQGELRPHYLPVLVDGCLSLFIPEETFDSQKIDNLKGTDLQVLKELTKLPVAIGSNEDLFLIQGSVASSTEESLDLEFEIRGITNFDSFKGTHGIVHRFSEQRSSSLGNTIPSKYIGQIVPVTIKNFRLSIDFFESKHLSSLLGFAPSTTQSLFIEASRYDYRLQIQAEGLSKKHSEPLFGLFPSLSELLLKSTGENILERFQQEV